jgi:hypothetical protein
MNERYQSENLELFEEKTHLKTELQLKNNTIE